MPTTACLEAVYAMRFGVPRSPAIEAVLTIAPPPRPRSTGATTFMPSQTALTFTARTRSKVSSGYSTSGLTAPRTPALLKNASRPPKRASAAST
ncbi:MAG: hypothetical protein A3E31_15125 [Candidatus Rokubacteria bacterium RIFCSPHIGHO2_12_FULL_73_22]|nr:MAG: hypothetical protein A3E31_15125 [Candidatus Rokubacteria bacterium RIFCSPHIGHO2_12_FULL_73_22]